MSYLVKETSTPVTREQLAHGERCRNSKAIAVSERALSRGALHLSEGAFDRYGLYATAVFAALGVAAIASYAGFLHYSLNLLS